MPDRPRIFDDIAGIAGGAISAFSGAREELSSIVRTRVDEVLATLQLVRREEFEAVREVASRARAAQEDLEARLNALESRLNATAETSDATTSEHGS